MGRYSQVWCWICRFRTNVLGQFMIGSIKNILSFSMALAFAGLLFSCSAERSGSAVLAVEVGNPEESRPKPPKKIPMQLVQVELQAAQLEEISKIDFALKSISLVDPTAPEASYAAEVQSIEKDGRLVLSPNSKRIFEFKVPASSFDNQKSLELSLKFNAAERSYVWAGGSQFDIESPTQSISLSLAASSLERPSADRLVISRAITKASLFEPTPELGSTTSSSQPEKTNNMGGIQSPGQIPTVGPVLSPVYRLKAVSN